MILGVRQHAPLSSPSKLGLAGACIGLLMSALHILLETVDDIVGLLVLTTLISRVRVLEGPWQAHVGPRL